MDAVWLGVMVKLPESDLCDVVRRAEKDLLALKEHRIFFTGGTGFIGVWMLEVLCQANRTLDLGVQVTVLTRDPSRFQTRFPHLVAGGAITLVAGDVRSLEPDGNRYDSVIHAATDASAALNRDNPLQMADTIVEGTRRTLELARQSGAGKVLMMSSGGIYGKFAPDITHIREDSICSPDPLDPYYTYSESKRMAELLCAIYAKQFGLQVPVARIFALAGPLLPLDTHFALGNFVGDALAGRTVRVGGDGTQVRSYLYAADLVVWLLAIMVRGQSSRAYNVGSDQGVTIGDLAHTVARLSPTPVSVHIAGRVDASNPVSYYVPDVDRARRELGLDVSVSLEEAITRMIAWHRSEGL